MLLMPTLAMAQGEMVSISELREQVEQMGRWKEKYDTVNGEVSIDVPIIVPEVERCPVVTVENQKPWMRQWSEKFRRKRKKETGETFCSYDIDGQTVEIQLLTNGNGSTTKYEAVKDVTIQAGQYAADDRQMAVEWKYPWEVDMRQRYIPGKNWTIEQTMEKWQNILNFVYPGQSIRIAPKRIQICRYENGDSTGFYQITAEQLIEGIPMIGAIASSQAENHFTVPYTNLENIRFFADSHWCADRWTEDHHNGRRKNFFCAENDDMGGTCEKNGRRFWTTLKSKKVFFAWAVHDEKDLLYAGNWQ